MNHVVLLSGQWHFQAGDDNPHGWLVTGIYAVLCILCWWEVLRPTTNVVESQNLPNSYRRLIQAAFAAVGGVVVAFPGLTLWNTWKLAPPLEFLVVSGFYAVVAAVLGIVFCREAFRSENQGKERKALSRTAWLWIAFTITVLGINKQLDLQTLITQWIRQFAEIEGLTKYRRLIQAGFAAVGAITAAIVGMRLWRLSKQASSSERLVIFGFLGLIGFILFRVAQFNNINFLGQYVMAQVPVKDLELIVPFLLCVAVWRSRYAPSSMSSKR